MALSDMIVRITSTYDDASAREMYDRFVDEGSYQFGNSNSVLGQVKDAKGGPVGYVLTVELGERILGNTA
jgi:hypothetical protein